MGASIDQVEMTTDPVGVTTDPVGVTTDPVGVTTDPVGVITDPVGVITDPVGVSIDQVEMTTDPVGVTTDPVSIETLIIGVAPIAESQVKGPLDIRQNQIVTQRQHLPRPLPVPRHQRNQSRYFFTAEMAVLVHVRWSPKRCSCTPSFYFKLYNPLKVRISIIYFSCPPPHTHTLGGSSPWP